MIRPGAIGDFVVSLPAMESLRADYTEVWCAEQNIPLARFADSARSIISAGLDRVGFLPSDDVIKRLSGFDSIISWYGTNRPEFREHMSVLPFRFLDSLPTTGAHAVDFYNRQASGLGASAPSRFPAIPCPSTPRTCALIHPFASSVAKRAPMAVFQSIAARLSATMPVRWLSGPEEELPREVQKQEIRVHDLYELACLLAGARIFVGNDSGISHVAAAVGTPVVVFFTASDPGVWAPRGSCVDILQLTAEHH